MQRPRRIVIVAFPQVQLLDLAGPLEVFSAATTLRPGSYDVRIVARGGHSIPTSSGVDIAARPLSRRLDEIDTLIVAGGAGTVQATRDSVLIGWIRRAATSARRTASVCTGAFLLARAGVLDGRRATTHWSACEELARRYPAVTVERDPIFVRDGSVFTSAGVTAGMDLALALVEDDLGPDVSLEVARWLVLFAKRPGGQAQFSVVLRAQAAERRPLRELQAWLPDHLGDDLSIPALASRVHMSERNFTRAFRRETGLTPAAYVERLRVERARTLLEGGEESLERVAATCGFAGAELMRRAFQRNLGVSPSVYRDHFRSAA